MSCITCAGGRGRDGAPISNTALLDDANKLYYTGDFVLVTYKGPFYPHPVSSPTNKLYELYGYAKYSNHSQGGKALLVLKLDVEARPDLYEVIPVDSDRHAVVCEQFNIDVNYVEPEQVIEVPLLNADLTVVDNKEEEKTLEPVEDKENGIDAFPRLTQETAITLKEFVDQHPDYSHHLQVLAQVKQGKLESEKRDNVIYIWHSETSDSS